MVKSNVQVGKKLNKQICLLLYRKASKVNIYIFFLNLEMIFEGVSKKYKRKYFFPSHSKIFYIGQKFIICWNIKEKLCAQLEPIIEVCQ